MKPLIGIVMRCAKYYENDNNVQYSFDFLRRCIINAGGEAFYLTPVGDVDFFDTDVKDFPEITEEEKKTIDFWLDSVNGLILPGGEKFTPYDKYILERAIEKDIPTLGLCLGMQLMSVYKTSKFDEDLDLINTDINHNVNINRKLVHTVKIDKDSKLYKIFGKDEIMVNSYHRYQVTENPYYKVVAMSPDGVIEAMEMKEKTFHIGVQWHPEKMYGVDDNANKIIDEFIRISSSRKSILDELRKKV